MPCPIQWGTVIHLISDLKIWLCRQCQPGQCHVVPFGGGMQQSMLQMAVTAVHFCRLYGEQGGCTFFPAKVPGIQGCVGSSVLHQPVCRGWLPVVHCQFYQ